jgi:N-acetylmuramoyl-L-alanine amidase
MREVAGKCLKGFITAALLVLGVAAVHAAVPVKAARVWPSPEYSRLALEFGAPVTYRYFLLDNPRRLVLDLEQVSPVPTLTDLPALVGPDDRYIQQLRVALNRPGVTRLVAELKGEVRPQVFTLKPHGDYGDRLVIDFYPAQEASVERQVQAAIGEAEKAVAQMPAPGQNGAKPAPRPASREYERLITVAIDAGHGGEDPGATGARGSREKDITLAIARRLKAHIDKQENMRAVLVRDGDYFIPLHERVQKARRQQADLFVSIHADAFLKSTARGSSVFALSEKGATSAAARWLAKRENDADLIGGVNINVKDVYLKQTLLSMSQDAQIRDSLILGREVLDELGEINDLHKSHVEQAGFAVLKAPDIPSILVETAFISNPDEEKRLNDEAYQDKLAGAIVDGIKGYFERNPPLSKARVAQSL